jgi:hypothetical protein
MKSIKNYRIDLANEGWNENSSEAFCASLPSIKRDWDSPAHGMAPRRLLLDGFHLVPALGNRFGRQFHAGADRADETLCVFDLPLIRILDFQQQPAGVRMESSGSHELHVADP